MLRKIIEIDKEKCNGCGACAKACHEGAIEMVDGKATLIRDDYCDGFGDCLPECPTGAIRFVEREAAAYDEKAVQERKAAMAKECAHTHPAQGGCPGSRMKTISHRETSSEAVKEEAPVSQLMQWPVQIKLLPTKAPFYKDARLLIAADCTAYSYAGFHDRFMKNRITLIGCPKLDMVSYAEKLGEILRLNEIKSVTVVRMEVPCCGGLVNAVKTALQQSGKLIPWQVYTISTDGNILED